VLLARQADVFVPGHDVRAAQGLGRIVEAHQARIIRCDPDRQRSGMAPDSPPLIRRQLKDAFQLGEGADARAQLPAPVVPVRRRRVGIEFLIEGPGLCTDREAETFLPGWRFLCFYAVRTDGAGNSGRLYALGPRRRTQIAPSQELKIHRYLMTLFFSLAPR